MTPPEATTSFTAEAAAGSFGRVAASFARLSRRYSTPLARHLVTLCELRPGESLLDVGTGAGVVALEAARRLSGNGRVLGVDVSAGMLSEARHAAAVEALHVELRQLDAETLPLADASFDVACSLFLLPHLNDPSKALRQMARVLRPGGRLALGVGAGPPLLSRAGLLERLRRLPGALAAARGRRLVAPVLLERLVESRLPPVSSTEHRGSPKRLRLRSLVRAAGFEDLRLSWAGGEAILPTTEEFWELQVTFSTAARLRLAAAPAQAVAALRREFAAASERVLSRGGQLVYLHGALLLTARRPGPRT